MTITSGNEWANRNYGDHPDFKIQNQPDVADWPCFAKYYITFPLTATPPSRAIVSPHSLCTTLATVAGTKHSRRGFKRCWQPAIGRKAASRGTRAARLGERLRSMGAADQQYAQ